MSLKNLAKTLKLLDADRNLAHEWLFSHRRSFQSAPFHAEMIREWHSSAPFVQFQCFRGSAKSSITEEAVIIAALYQEFHNILLVGDTEQRAKDRLTSVQVELGTNEKIQSVFGDYSAATASTWGASRVVLKNGVCIQAIGKGQSLRGVKYLQYRPDLAVLDDIENEEDVASPANLMKVMHWLFAVLRPAMEISKARLRVCATPLAPECVSEHLRRDPGWRTLVVPIEAPGADGARVPSWPGKWPLKAIDAEKEQYARLGKLRLFEQEYYCRARPDAERIFDPEKVVYIQMPRTYEAVYAMYDPARTTRPNSSHTGVVVWSPGPHNTLTVWESGGHLWMPDEMIDDIFRINTIYRPVEIGVEIDGLHEYLRTPLLHAQMERGMTLPIDYKSAPRDKSKLEFIRNLQPWLISGRVRLYGGPGMHKDLIEQLEQYPTGRLDVPNALAYAIIRTGREKYPEFTQAHVDHSPVPMVETDKFLVAAADGYATYMLLAGVPEKGPVHVLRDHYMEGSPSEVLPLLLRKLELERPARIVLPAAHWRTIDPVGLRPAARATGYELGQAAEPGIGEAELRLLLARMDGLRVHPQASWALQGLSGGCQSLEGRKSNRYDIVATALEAMASRLRTRQVTQSLMGGRVRYAHDGRPYLSTVPDGTQTQKRR